MKNKSTSYPCMPEDNNKARTNQASGAEWYLRWRYRVFPLVTCHARWSGSQGPSQFPWIPVHPVKPSLADNQVDRSCPGVAMKKVVLYV